MPNDAENDQKTPKIIKCGIRLREKEKMCEAYNGKNEKCNGRSTFFNLNGPLKWRGEEKRNLEVKKKFEIFFDDNFDLGKPNLVERPCKMLILLDKHEKNKRQSPEIQDGKDTARSSKGETSKTGKRKRKWEEGGEEGAEKKGGRVKKVLEFQKKESLPTVDEEIDKKKEIKRSRLEIKKDSASAESHLENLSETKIEKEKLPEDSEPSLSRK